MCNSIRDPFKQQYSDSNCHTCYIFILNYSNLPANFREEHGGRGRGYKAKVSVSFKNVVVDQTIIP